MAIPDTTPLAVQNGALELLQSGFFIEGENAQGGDGTLTSSDYSNGEYNYMNDAFTTDIYFNFTVDYKIPASNVGFAFRGTPNNGEHVGFDLNVNGETVNSFSTNSLSDGLRWINTGTTGINNDLAPGTYEARIKETDRQTDGDLEVDCLFVFDDRYTYNFDNTTDSNDTLAGPELFPDQETYSLANENVAQPASEATLSQTWNDTTGDQFVEIDFGGNVVKNTNSDAATAAAPAGSVPDTVTSRVGLSRFGTRTNTTPRDGFNGQTIDDHQITTDPDSQLRNGIGELRTRIRTPDGDLSSHSGDLVEAGTIDTNGDLLTRGIYSSFDIPSAMAITSNELLEFRRD